MKLIKYSHLILFILIANPCVSQTLTEDTIAIRNIMQANGLNLQPWEIMGMIEIENDRVSLFRILFTKMQVISADIGKLDKMEVFQSGWPSISELPQEISMCSSLVEINLIGNKFTEFPIELCSVPSLQRINLSMNKITSIPQEISNLKFLTDIDLSENEFDTLPAVIGSLGSLKTLTIVESNNLVSIPEEIGNLKSLWKLGIGNNKQLTTLPSGIGGLTSLQILYLIGNGITSLPDSIGNLFSLEELDIHINKFESLPQSIGKLKRLKILRAERNNLTIVPSSIGALDSIQELNLSYNNLKTLPDSIVKLDPGVCNFCYNDSLVFTERQKAWLGVTDYTDYFQKYCESGIKKIVKSPKSKVKSLIDIVVTKRKIEFQLPDDGNITLAVSDLSGKHRTILCNEFKPAGAYTFFWRKYQKSSGTYLITLKTDKSSVTKKFVLTK